MTQENHPTMSHSLDRRQFLQLSAALSAAGALPLNIQSASRPPQAEAPNILIIVFDALSALHLSLLGYPRGTDSHIGRLAERATVYHNHFAAGSFTTPGTASMLTGVYPFTHRALHYSERVLPEFGTRNIFALFDDHFRMGYSHNPLVNVFLRQFTAELDENKNRGDLYLTRSLTNDLFQNDEDISLVSWVRIMQRDQKFGSSLFLGKTAEALQRIVLSSKAGDFPRGLPSLQGGHSYLLEKATDWAISHLPELPQPFLSYIHFWPPHEPYNTRKEFVDAFLDDGYTPLEKPVHLFGQHLPQERLAAYRRWYDEFILYVDAEFGRLYQALLEGGLLDNTWLVFTSDHGEMFERGIWEHHDATMHQPLVRVPLMISAPGQSEHRDVTTPTSAVDLLPTLLHLSGKTVPDWCQGGLLPPFGEEVSRPLYALDAKHNAGTYGPLDIATAMLVEWPYKLVRYTGYEVLPGGQPLYELFDLERDPEEMDDLYGSQPALAKELAEELQARLAQPDALAPEP